MSDLDPSDSKDEAITIVPPASNPLDPTAPAPNLLQQAQEQYPVLKNYDYGYTENFRPNSGFLEHWEPGDPGVAPASPTDLNSLRPSSLPIDKPGVEIRDPTTSPSDVAADITSHHLVNVDPTVKNSYDQLQKSITPQQETTLQDQYQYAQKNEGETGTYDDWKQRAGMPGVLRGYTFQQWPQDFNDKFYTPEQKANLDNLKSYLQKGGKNGAQ